jgi:hypothetical protein
MAHDVGVVLASYGGCAGLVRLLCSRWVVLVWCAQFQQLAAFNAAHNDSFMPEKHYPKFGTYDYTKLADHIGLGTNVVFGEHDRATLKDEQAEANIH